MPSPCVATLPVGGSSPYGVAIGGGVTLHCARTDTHTQHRATLRGKLYTWESPVGANPMGPPAGGWDGVLARLGLAHGSA